MFTRDFREREQREIELPGKKVDDFVELLHCMYPPIKPVFGECKCQQSRIRETVLWPGTTPRRTVCKVH